MGGAWEVKRTLRRRTEDYIGGIIHFRECGANTVMQYTLGAT